MVLYLLLCRMTPLNRITKYDQYLPSTIKSRWAIIRRNFTRYEHTDLIFIILKHKVKTTGYKNNIQTFRHQTDHSLFLPLLRSPPLSSPSSLGRRGLSPERSLCSRLSLLSPLCSSRSFSPLSQDSLVRNSPLILRGS